MTDDPLFSADAALSLAMDRVAHARALLAPADAQLSAHALLGSALDAIRDAHGHIGDLYAQSSKQHRPHQ